MPNAEVNWASIFERYKLSGLSQPAFCRENDLAYNQFQYRWHQHNVRLKAKQRAASLETPPAENASFEAITLTAPERPPPSSSMVELSIHLPNQIRCDAKVDLCNNGFSSLLAQLVKLC